MAVPLAGDLEEEPLQDGEPVRLGGDEVLLLRVVLLREVQKDGAGLPSSRRRASHQP